MSKLIKDIYFIGDSFTFGHGCSPLEPHEYSTLYPASETNRLWTDIVAEKLNGHCYNFGTNGASMETMLDCLIKYMHCMDSKDIVVISTGLIDRVDVFAPWFQFEDMTDEARNQILKSSFLLDLHEQPHKQNMIISDERLRNLVEYVHLNRIPYEKEILKHYTDTIFFLKLELEQRDIEVFIWDWNDVLKFETIAQDTNDKIVDGHFSWNGHREFAKYFLKEYVNLK